MITGGTDIGSLSVESVIFEKKEGVIGYSIVLTGANSRKSSEVSLEQALNSANVRRPELSYVVSTGCGRGMSGFANESITEITCLANGVNHLFPDCRTIIDIGGQDTKVINIDEEGRVIGFDMNDKCAAGTGRFLEVMAMALNVDLQEMGKRSLHFKEDIEISSLCTVFAESEVVSLVSEGREVEDILHALSKAVADRTVSLLERVGSAGKVAMTGGVAKNMGVVRAIEERLGQSMMVYHEPQIVGALGAALIASEKMED
ncbi:MAG: 2-hydroxyglutaryl-CoA dehydratase [Syntrophobacterales bacterium]|nr:MAG: 2-hydroxyglutaryl-CoA dehydratase [Syntrophobacterales bacterium]